MTDIRKTAERIARAREIENELLKTAFVKLSRAERAYIEAATMERCALVADVASRDNFVTAGQGRVVGACLEIGHRIRAMMHDLVKEETR